MTLEDSRDHMGSAAGQPSSHTPANGGGPQVGDSRLRRGRAAWLVAGISLLVLFVTGLLFARQAVERQRVQKDLDAAAAAMASARAFNVTEDAPAGWQEARSRMDNAMAELHRQEGRFVLFRSYRSVHELLTKAIDAAELVKGTTDGVRLVWETQALRKVAADSTWAAIAAAQASVDAVTQLIGKVEGCQGARNNKYIRKDLEVIKRRALVYGNECNEAQQKFLRGEMDAAKLLADALKGVADTCCKDLSNILTKFKCT
jgi:hypothetical protein